MEREGLEQPFSAVLPAQVIAELRVAAPVSGSVRDRCHAFRKDPAAYTVVNKTILALHRSIPLHGLGGAPGEVGATWVRRSDGRLEELAGADQTVVEPGEAVIVRTPTGGHFETP